MKEVLLFLTLPFLFSSLFAQASNQNNLYAFAETAIETYSESYSRFSFVEPNCAIILSESHVGESCGNQNDGSINLTFEGATGNITFAWTNGETTEDINGLAAGSYTVVATDEENCQSSLTIEIPVNPTVVPVFYPWQNQEYCVSDSPFQLPDTSLNGIEGTWNNNIFDPSVGTQTVFFTPDQGQCASIVELDLIVNPGTTPTFEMSQFEDICSSDDPIFFSTTSNEGVSGIWNINPFDPSLGDQTIVFIPKASECAEVINVTIIVEDCGCLNPATVDAGASQVINFGEVLTLFGQIGGGVTSGIWSGGVGSFVDATDLGTNYTPDASEIGTTVIFTLTSEDPDGPGDCVAVSSTVDITFLAESTGNPFLGGRIYFDANQNKVKDSNEEWMAGQKVFFDPPQQTVLSNQNGYFKQLCEVGTTYTLSWVPDPNWVLTTDNTQYTVDFINGLPANLQKDFGLRPISNFHKEQASISSNFTVCNQNVVFWASAQNRGTYVESGKIELIYDPATVFVSSITDPEVIDEMNHRLVWNYNSLAPFNSVFQQLILKMPDENATNTSLDFTLRVYRDSMGVDVLMDTFIYKPTVLCAYDPNDKLVSPAGVQDEHYTIHDKKLTYTIRFQNTGNASATDIRILDTIDVQLDMNSLRVMESSFPIQTYIKDRAIEFLFKDIFLPDSTNNEPKSHGFITYEIQPNESLADYSKIKNTAHIIFDLNAAIVTNTTYNTMVTMIPVALNEIENEAIFIRPNPAKDYIFISAKNQQQIVQVQIFNTLGQLVLTQKNTKIDVSHLQKGAYLVKVEVGDKIGIEQLIID